MKVCTALLVVEGKTCAKFEKNQINGLLVRQKMSSDVQNGRKDESLVILYPRPMVGGIITVLLYDKIILLRQSQIV